MRIKAKIAYNHEMGSLPRGAVIQETKERAEALIAAGKFEQTSDEITHRAQPEAEVARAPEPVKTPAGAKLEEKTA